MYVLLSSSSLSNREYFNHNLLLINRTAIVITCDFYSKIPER